MIILKSPGTAEEFKGYYDLRYQILRKPWNQPPGSEKDDLEKGSFHIMALDNGKVVGVGRLHNNSPEESQIRFMAVDLGFGRKGIGSLILKRLELEAVKRRSKYIVLNARENAVPFYKKHGYRVIEPGHTLFGAIPHSKMRKDLEKD